MCVCFLPKAPFVSLPLQTKLDDTTVSDQHALPQPTDSGRRVLLTRAHLDDFHSAVSAPARIPRPMIAAVHGVTFRLALDALCAVDMLWAASDAHATFSIKEVEIWLAAGMGTLATYVAWRKLGDMGVMCSSEQGTFGCLFARAERHGDY